MNRKTKRFFKEIKAAVLRLIIYAVMFFIAALAICIIVSLPEIIGTLIFG